MSSITIHLQDEQMARLKELANHLGISVGDLARIGIGQLLVAPDDGFEQTVNYVLKKNEDLYRRLA